MTQKERLIQYGEIEISVHPITKVRRLAVLMEDDFKWAPRAKQIILKFTVFYLNENGERYNLESFQPYIVLLQADSSIRVDTEGNKVIQPVNIEDPEYLALPTEYDYLIDKLDRDINPFNVILGTTLLRDYQGKFNR